MSPKKYLTLEETAEALGISTKDLIALRERQEIRGFADRGTWKFKSEDVEEYQRRKQADSNPDVPMLDDVGDQPTIIRKSVLDEDDAPRGASDSDVRLIIDPEMDPASDVLPPGLNDSDSDVRLIDDEALHRKKKSSSNIRLGAGNADSDSDVRIAAAAKKESDSDVKLVAPGTQVSNKTPPEIESDSDVKLVGKKPQDTEQDIPKITIARAMPKPGEKKPGEKKPGEKKPGSASVFGDDDLILDDDSGLTLKAGSGIALEKLVDSGVSLESGDSGIALLGRGDDDDLVTAGSGIHLDAGSGPLSDDSAKTLHDVSDSSMTLKEEDSGISLDLGADSGIALSTGDSGIALESPADSGISLESSDELNRTIPMMAAGSDTDQTHLEVPQLGSESAYELRMPGSDSEEGADTSVILFDDESDVEDHAATMKRKRVEDDDAGESFDLEDAGEEVESLDDELDVAEDVVGEDDELDDMDVFDAADEDFDESFSTGESHAEFVAPTRGAAPAPVEAEWGGGTFAGLLITTGVMAVCGMLMFDLVRSMWGWQEPGAVTGQVMSLVKDMF